MLKLIGSAVIVAACAGILQSWRRDCILRIQEMEQLCDLYRSARWRMQTEHITMPSFFRQYASALAEKKSGTSFANIAGDSAVTEFADTFAGFLEERTYPTGELAWQEAVKCLDWHLKREEMALLVQSGSAFFGRDLSDNLKKLDGFEAQMKECHRRANAEFAEKNRVFTPVGLMLGVLLVIVLL
jgi:hypothetical protein